MEQYMCNMFFFFLWNIGCGFWTDDKDMFFFLKQILTKFYFCYAVWHWRLFKKIISRLSENIKNFWLIKIKKFWECLADYLRMKNESRSKECELIFVY